MTDVQFYLGTHRPHWLWSVAEVPLFISYRQLRGRVSTYPRATTRYAIDSGGFTELKQYGEWTVTPEQYVADLYRFRDEIGPFDWAAPQDWMCEPVVINGGTFKGATFAGTGLTVAEHQQRTVANFLELRDLAPDLPIIPVIQGYTDDDYHRCVDMFQQAGIDLREYPVVGVGSVCRRQATGEIAGVFDSLHGRGLNMHGFGVKIDGLEQYADQLTSADSLAWSYWARCDARKGIRHCAKKTCANCLHYALAWRDKVLQTLAGRQTTLALYGGS